MLTLKNLLALFLFTFFTYALQAQITYVDTAATGSNNGKSWKDAYTNLQSAVKKVKKGQIWVAQGTYKPTSGTDRTATFNLHDSVEIYGGFNGTETSLGQRNWKKNITLLSGDIRKKNYKKDNSQHVVSAWLISNKSLLDGFVIMHGYALATVPAKLEPYGGGIYIYLASPQIKNCRIDSNYAESYGGGISINGSYTNVTDCSFRGDSCDTLGNGGAISAINCTCDFLNCDFIGNHGQLGGAIMCNDAITIKNCFFDSNTALVGAGCFINDAFKTKILNSIFTHNVATTYGGAIYNDGSWMTVENCVIYNNRANQYGGGIYLSGYATYGNFKLNNSLIMGNYAVRDGGGMFSYFSRTSINSCVFSGNKCNGNGGGLYALDANRPLRLFNNTFAYNSAGKDGGGLYNYGNASTNSVINCIFWKNDKKDIYNHPWGDSAKISYSILTSTYPGVKNSTADPMFKNAKGKDTIAGTMDDDLRLKSGSPAINTGKDTAGFFMPNYDVEGMPRISNDTIERGAYELYPCDSIITPSYAGKDTSLCVIDSFRLAGNTPKFGYGKWLIVSGGGTLDNALKPNAKISSLPMGTTVLEWRIQLCDTFSSSFIKIKRGGIAVRPTIIYSKSTKNLCIGDSIYLSIAKGYSSYLWSNGVAKDSILVKSSGSFYASVKDSSGCAAVNSDTAAITIHSLPLQPVISASGSLIFCNGKSVTLYAPTGYKKYSWSSGQTTQSINLTTSGTFEVKVTDSNGCVSPLSTKVSIVVNANPAKPIIKASRHQTICKNDSIDLFVTGSYSKYLWSNGDTTQKTKTGVAGKFTLYIIDSNGCKSATSNFFEVILSLPSAPTINISGKTNFCAGDSVVLSASSGYTYYKWSRGDSSTKIVVKKSGTISLWIKDSIGCISPTSKSVIITSYKLPNQPIITSKDSLSFCDGKQAVLSGPSGLSIYKWNTGDTTNNIIVTKPGGYSLTVTDSNGCVSSVSTITKVIVWKNPIQPTISVSGKTSFCDGDSVNLKAPIGKPFYQWSSGEITQDILVKKQGNYTLKIRMAA
ncbi:MAG: hypothetical protein NTX03_00475 [Bacteroidetes bacterium]|nr:hypothetical protein [Bacteroidota bacterium]